MIAKIAAIILALALLACAAYAITHESGAGPGAAPVCVDLATGEPCRIPYPTEEP